MKRIIASLDRIENDLYIFVPDDDCEEYKIPVHAFPGFHERDIAYLTLDGKNVTAIERDDEERDRRLNENTERLHRLFSNRKKK